MGSLPLRRRSGPIDRRGRTRRRSRGDCSGALVGSPPPDHRRIAGADATVAAGYAHGADGRYAPDEEAVGPLRGGFPFDMRAVVEFLVAAGSILPRVETAFRDGAGIRPAELQAALADPTAIITYGGDLVYCLQEGLADGGAGFGGTFGGPALRRLLAAYGFAVVATYVQPVGYELTRAVPDRAASRPG